jgi:hypothetical protein
VFTLPSIFNVKDFRELNIVLLDLWNYLRLVAEKPRVFDSTTSLSLTDNDSDTRVRVDATGGARVVTLNTLLSADWQADVVKVDASANAVTINGVGISFNTSAGGVVASLSITTRFTGYRLIHLGGGVFDAQQIT